MLAGSGPDATVKLVDFGLSTFFKHGQRFKDVVGSLYYVAPEMVAQTGQFGNAYPLNGYRHEVDLWSLGVILYILLSGEPGVRFEFNWNFTPSTATAMKWTWGASVSSYTSYCQVSLGSNLD